MLSEPHVAIGYKVPSRGFVVFDTFSGGTRVSPGIRRVACSPGSAFVDILCYHFLSVAQGYNPTKEWDYKMCESSLQPYGGGWWSCSPPGVSTSGIPSARLEEGLAGAAAVFKAGLHVRASSSLKIQWCMFYTLETKGVVYGFLLDNVDYNPMLAVGPFRIILWDLSSRERRQDTVHEKDRKYFYFETSPN